MKYTQDPFKLAEALKMKLKMLLLGEPGTGKTYTALELATRLAAKDGGKIAFIDTEGASGKAQIYAPNFTFYHIKLADGNPLNLIDAIKAAEQFGYTVLIIDSLTWFWNGPGGVLQIADTLKNDKKQGWKVAKPAHQKLVQAIHEANIHIIATVRVKNSYGSAEGKMDWDSASIEARQDGELEHEFDLSGILDHSHNLTIRKSRCLGIPKNYEINPLNYDGTIDTLHNWLNAGNKPAHWTDYPTQVARVDKWIDDARKAGWPIDTMLSMVKPRNEYTTPEAYREAILAAKDQPPPVTEEENPPPLSDKTLFDDLKEESLQRSLELETDEKKEPAAITAGIETG